MSDQPDNPAPSAAPRVTPTLPPKSPPFAAAPLKHKEPEPTAHPTDHSSLLSPGATDRVYPIRSVISVNPTASALRAAEKDSYFYNPSRAHPPSQTSTSVKSREVRTGLRSDQDERASDSRHNSSQPEPLRPNAPRFPPPYFDNIVSGHSRADSDGGDQMSAAGASSATGEGPGRKEDIGLVTTRFKHVVTEDGHAVITGRDGEDIQRCEDEPIHIPGAVQSFGLLVALQEDQDGKIKVRIVSENSKRIIGYTPRQLFALDSFTDILSEEQADNLMDHVDLMRDEDADVATNGPDVFTLTIRSPGKSRSTKLWCAMHMNYSNPGIAICEFELEDDPYCPPVPPGEQTPELPEDTLDSQPTDEEYEESTTNVSRPLRVLRSARKRKGDAAAMEFFNIISQVQQQLANAPNLDVFLKVLVGVVKELTGFHRVMIYQFDQQFNGYVVTELVDPRATKDLYKGLHFPASDIPEQARNLYKINRVRLLYDRDQETARLVCRTVEDLKTPLDLTYAYLRAMSPIHLKYLANMAVRSSMSISINAFNELWGLIACHIYGPNGMRVPFPIRKMCRLVGDSASRNIERLSYANRLQARKLINTVPSKANPAGYIVSSSEDLLKLFDADFGLLAINNETKIMGHLENSQEALVMLEYLRVRKFASVFTSTDIVQDFPDLQYPPGFHVIAGLLLVPLSVGGKDFIVFFRKSHLREVRWAGNPYEKVYRQGTQSFLEPRKSFRTWSEMVVGKCREWRDEEVETAAVLCLVYGKFIEVWRQKESALESSQLTRLLLANSAHEVRTPLNAIINYLEIALESSLDSETRENLSRSHSASKSLIYVINDLLDLTKAEEGGDLVKVEPFDLKMTVREATDPFIGDAKRKGINYEVIEGPALPVNVIGDQRKVRQAISNICANAIQHTSKGGVTVEVYVIGRQQGKVDLEVAVQDTGIGMSSKTVDDLFRELEQVQTEASPLNLSEALVPTGKGTGRASGEQRTLGLGLAVVARIVRNMNGQLRLKSDEGKGTRFVIQFPFCLPDDELLSLPADATSEGTLTPGRDDDEILLVDRDAKRIPAAHSRAMSRKNSSESQTSRKSLLSQQSVVSGKSAKSSTDRLIEDLQKPHNQGGKRQSMGEPSLSNRVGYAGRNSGGPRSGTPSPQKTRSKSMEYLLSRSEQAQSVQQEEVVPPHRRETPAAVGGELFLANMASPVKAIKMPEDESAITSPTESQPSRKASSVLDDAHVTMVSPARTEASTSEANQPGQTTASTVLSSEKMTVLVAEDDPVNSKIMKKRLEKLGHIVCLTVNGQECATTYGNIPAHFDVVLMDMQMPIVDGLTSTKLIRSFESTHPPHHLSPRAALNGRVPIIAVSASLIEKERQTYVDAGFDGWILKPISFPRLSILMAAIVDDGVREECLYVSGQWEKGGWFQKAPVEKGREEGATVDETATQENETPTQEKRREDGTAAEETCMEQEGREDSLAVNETPTREKGKVLGPVCDEDLGGEAIEPVAEAVEEPVRVEKRDMIGGIHPTSPVREFSQPTE